MTLTGDRVHEYARLTVTKDLLHNSGTCSYCGQIRRWQQQGRVIAIYDVSLSYGFRGTVDVTFPVPAAYEGKTLTVAHCLKDALDTRSVTVSGGKVTVTADSLSPFVILDTSKGAVNPDTGAVAGVSGTGVPGTGDPKAPQAPVADTAGLWAGGGNGAVVLCLLSAMLAAVLCKRRRRAESETETAE